MVLPHVSLDNVQRMNNSDTLPEVVVISGTPTLEISDKSSRCEPLPSVVSVKTVEPELSAKLLHQSTNGEFPTSKQR